MNRRNFILGLGTAATLSGAASVTGAALSGTVSAQANFQIVTQDQLTVEKNPDVNLASNPNYSDVNPVSSFDHVNATSNADPGGTQNLTVNQQSDGQLEMAFAANNTNTSKALRNATLGGDPAYNGSTGGGQVGPLQVTNTGGSSKTIGVSYDLGPDYNSGNMTADDVAQLFTFRLGNDRISPAQGTFTTDVEGTGDAGMENAGGTNTATIGAGETEVVNFVVNYSNELVNKVASAGSGGTAYSFSEDGLSAVDLLDQVIFGEA